MQDNFAKHQMGRNRETFLSYNKMKGSVGVKDMNGQTILLISDMRQVYLAEILTKKGMSVRRLDIRNSQTVEEQLLKLKNFLPGRQCWCFQSR